MRPCTSDSTCNYWQRGLIPDDYVLRLFSKCLTGNSCSFRRSFCRSGFRSLPLPKLCGSDVLRLPGQFDPCCGKLDKYMRRRQRSETCPLPDCCYKFCCRVFCYVTLAALLGLGLIVLF
ncbi:hypothetical protein MSG28_009819 [Choristoneura fumiferana]|uniref:Uncharacterized protein n=1 Tax=Choristoneura fumiferana TaxID=7141 RepID=A0ACC0JCQ1_CHOFU|nr:hypothetical protein MSG28_009819 [Choristoneura fumiferana]